MAKRRVIRSFFDKERDKVNLYWRGRNVMAVLNVSRTYAIQGLPDDQVAALVLKDVRKEATGLIEDFESGEASGRSH